MLRTTFLTVAVSGLLASIASADAPPLPERIDQAIAAAVPDFDKKAAPLAGDAEFLRRVYLDLTGMVPTPAQARAFLADNDPSKRAKLIDQLLASPEHARHLQQVFDVVLMERRADKNVPRPQWQEYLRQSFADNKPWDQLVREILVADGSDPKARPAAKFFLDRDGEPNLLTRDIGRLFLGMNLTCCQCHDHPLVESYKQDHYYGLYAFLNRSTLFKDAKLGLVMAEKADGDVTFQSVRDPNKLTKSAVPRVPGGATVTEPAFEKGQEYAVAPTKDVRPVPKFSRRAQLAPQVADPSNAHFRRNIANRLWAMMMGRGLIDPIDLDHVDNPPSHPELLDLLASEMAERKFDIRSMLRDLALTKTYQRSSEATEAGKELGPDTFTRAILKPLSPEQLAWSLMQSTGVVEAERKALGDKGTEPALYAKLSANASSIVTLFAGPGGKPDAYESSVDQALFLNNGALVRGWLAPNRGLTDRLTKLPDDQVAEELFLSILTRLPEAEEKKEIEAYLKNRTANRPQAVQDLAWALLTSAEFRFNH